MADPTSGEIRAFASGRMPQDGQKRKSWISTSTVKTEVTMKQRLARCARYLLLPLVALATAVPYPAQTIIFDVPGALVTAPQSMNGDGTITGYHTDSPGPSIRHGFVRDKEGNITTFDAPNAFATEPASINENGDITGFYRTSTFPPVRGFLRDKEGNFTTFSVLSTPDTRPRSISDAGDITGYYTDGIVRRGFVRDKEGNITTFECQGSYIRNR